MSILTSYDKAPDGYRSVYIRAFQVNRDKIPELKKELDSHTSRLLQATVAVDLTTFDGAELEHRVAEALQETGVAMPMAAD